MRNEKTDKIKNKLSSFESSCFPYTTKLQQNKDDKQRKSMEKTLKQLVIVDEETLGTSLLYKAYQTPCLLTEPKNTLRKNNQPSDCRNDASMDEKQEKKLTVTIHRSFFCFFFPRVGFGKKVLVPKKSKTMKPLLNKPSTSSCFLKKTLQRSPMFSFQTLLQRF